MRPTHSYAFVIAGIASGVGKTTVSLALMSALRHRGLTVQPFKIGPDFIDARLHATACGLPSHNLDSWMLSQSYNLRCFQTNMQGKDVGVVEAMMGLYDGRSGSTEEGSSAEMAKQLKLPVILVVDASAVARSVAASVLGYKLFDSGINLIGVIFNRISGSAHLRYLKEAMSTLGGLQCFGGIPSEPSVRIPERHLGLTTAEEKVLSRAVINRLAHLAATHIDLDKILKMTGLRLPQLTPDHSQAKRFRPKVTIAVAWDKAFCFYYPDNLQLLEEGGAKLNFFSPITSHGLPAGTQGIYLGGGYPELYARELSRNRPMRAALKDFIEAGGPVYAECGGLMYLAKGLRDYGKREYPMVGVYPFKTRMLPRIKALGYREVVSTKKTFIERGEKMRGHEFHYSEVCGCPAGKEIQNVYFIQGSGKTKIREGYRYKNCLGSYVHLHFGSNPKFARSFVAACRGY